MDKIKIIDFATTSQGAWRLLYSRVNKINSDPRFCNIIVCPDGEEVSLIREGGVDVRTMSIERGLGIINVLREMLDFYRILKEEKPVVIHTHNSKAGAVGRLIGYLYNRTHRNKIYIIHQVHGYHFTKFKGFKRKLFYQVEKWLNFFSDSIFFQNRYEYELTEKSGIRKARLELIGNGINFSSFRKEDHVQEDVKKIVCIARIEPVKNHEMIIRSAALLRKKTDKFLFEMIGEGKTDNLLKVADKLGVREHIKFTGKVGRERLMDYLNTADISVLSSKKEGKPRSLMESMFYGIPCVGTDVVGTNEIIEDGVSGYLVPLDDDEAFTDRIYRLISDDSLREEMGMNAEKRCRENFNEDDVIEKIKKIYADASSAREK